MPKLGFYMDNLIITQEGAVRTITINRPSKLNALNIELIDALSGALDEAQDDPQTRAVILTGSGDKAFVAGADVAEFAHFSKEEGQKLSASGHDKLFAKIPLMTTPVIAAVNGFALGGGLELAMSCHMRIASENAIMGLPEVGLGVIPGYGGTQRLPQLVGRGIALEMMLSAKKIDAAEAHRIGLVNTVVPLEGLMEACMKLAQRITANAPTAIAAAIDAVNAGEAHLSKGHQAEIEAFGACFGSEDFEEGTSAFLEKRKPNFSNR